MYDKKGVGAKKLIIDPALEYIRGYCYDYCQANGKSTEMDVLRQMFAANGIIMSIDSGDLANNIVKYIAPEFAVKQLEYDG